MTSHLSQPFATEALNRREQQVRGYLQECALDEAKPPSAPRQHRLLSWAGALLPIRIPGTTVEHHQNA